MRSPNATRKETEKSPKAARDPLTGRSGGSNRTLPPSVRSIPERSNSSRIAIRCVQWTPIGRSQSPVNLAFIFFTRPDAETSSDRTLKDRVWSLLHSEFTSCELTGRWTVESGAASGHPFLANLQSSFTLPVPN